MALIQTSLIWVAYAVCLGILALVAAFFIFLYQQPGERGVSVTAVSYITILALLGTVLLTPVDVALVSATNRSKYGAKKEWATPETVDSILFQLKVAYYTLYSLDALLCLLVVPFTYFWHEEYDEVDAAEGRQTVAGRLWGAFKYTIAFVVIVLALFLVGLFIPIATGAEERHPNLGYLKDLLSENHGERALTFAVGILIAAGTVVYALYVGPGLALLPLSLIKSAPRVSAPQLAATTSSQLAQNRERQRQLEGRNQSREGGLDARDRRELESLVREERTLVRRERLAAENRGEGQNFFIRSALKIEAVFRPLKLIFGLLLVVVSLIIFASMIVTCVDKIKNSVCKAQCGYILGETLIFQPVNWLLKVTSEAFPIDYILFLMLTLLFFFAGVIGLGTIGIRFLWVTFFRIRRGSTLPNALLLATSLLTLMSFALNYALTMIVAPQYATWGPQTFCDLPSNDNKHLPDCTDHLASVKPCSERADNPNAQIVCTPSFVSTFLNRIAVAFPVLGGIHFWAQFAFLGLFAIVFAVMLFRVPKLDERTMDEDLLEEEEEGLLASTGRRFGATWQDITGRAQGVKRSDYGAVSGNDESAGRAEE